MSLSVRNRRRGSSVQSPMFAATDGKCCVRDQRMASETIITLSDALIVTWRAKMSQEPIHCVVGNGSGHLHPL